MSDGNYQYDVDSLVVARGRARQDMHRGAGKLSGRPRNDEARRKIRELDVAVPGLSASDVAKRFGVSRTFVHKARSECN